MSVSYLNEQIASFAAGAVLSLSLSLGGCASSSPSLMDARDEAQTPASKYLLLEDLPPKRENAITLEEWSKLKRQLIDTRDQQAAAVKSRYDGAGS
jgi:hypothetical protein